MEENQMKGEEYGYPFGIALLPLTSLYRRHAAAGRTSSILDEAEAEHLLLDGFRKAPLKCGACFDYLAVPPPCGSANGGPWRARQARGRRRRARGSTFRIFHCLVMLLVEDGAEVLRPASMSFSPL